MTKLNLGTENDELISKALDDAYKLLPGKLRSSDATAQLLAIGMQESRFKHRQQIGGPARGFWQFERGGGVRGVLNHKSSKDLALEVCKARGVEATADAVYKALDKDDALAAAFARLLLFTDPKALPKNCNDGWDCYMRTWRPGKPHRSTWDDFYNKGKMCAKEWEDSQCPSH